ncbi:MAG: hypothetical protein LBQ75_03875, partial [Zoogloeaceae bacterium]|nr:hypothetical protein [Zoogloeaceae bacterium]
NFLVQYSARLDIMVIENFSDYTESHIKPYLADLLEQGKISRYFLFEENIGANVLETILTQDREKLLTHEYFMSTDGDLTVQDPGWLDEQISILANPEVAVSGVRLDTSNLPPDDKFPGANTWIPPAIEVAGKNYLDSPTGWHLTLFKPGLFFAALNYILQSEKGTLIDIDVRIVLEALGFKWVSTKKARAYHLTWDAYNNPDHPYAKWKLSKTPEELWRHKRYCGYTLYDQAHETRGERLRPKATTAPQNAPLSGDAKIPCYVLTFFDHETVIKSLNFLVQYSARLDIMVIENFSDYTESHIKPYLADLLKQGKISRYFLFEENIGMNAMETVIAHDREKLAEHEYFMITDGDLTVQDPGWLDEQISILANPEVAVSGVRLDMTNLPSSDKYPDAPQWVPPAIEVAGKNYLEGKTGWSLALFKTGIFFLVLDLIKAKKGQLSDANSFHILEKHLGLKWVKTKKAQAYHLTWDVYADPDHPYAKWKLAHTYHEIWHHSRYCDYALFDKDNLP